MPRTREFWENILDGFAIEMIVSKLERDTFRCTGHDVKASEGSIKTFIQDYVDSLEKSK